MFSVSNKYHVRTAVENKINVLHGIFLTTGIGNKINILHKCFKQLFISTGVGNKINVLHDAAAVNMWKHSCVKE